MPRPELPKGIEYALKVLLCLAESHPQPVRAREAAACMRIPPSEAAKILYHLKWTGVVRSQRGSKGGFWLTRPAEQILIEEVAKGFPPFAVQDAAVAADPLLRAWRDTTGNAYVAWEKLTLADLLQRTKQYEGCSQFACCSRRQEAASSRAAEPTQPEEKAVNF